MRRCGSNGVTDRHVGPQLAGEPHVAARSIGSAALLLLARRRQLNWAVRTHPAGRAAAAAAAHRGVRDVGKPAGFGTLVPRNLDRAAVGVADADETAPALPVATARASRPRAGRGTAGVSPDDLSSARRLPGLAAMSARPSGPMRDRPPPAPRHGGGSKIRAMPGPAPAPRLSAPARETARTRDAPAARNATPIIAWLRAAPARSPTTPSRGGGP
jgi:hypothetical protein